MFFWRFLAWPLRIDILRLFVVAPAVPSSWFFSSRIPALSFLQEVLAHHGTEGIAVCKRTEQELQSCNVIDTDAVAAAARIHAALSAVIDTLQGTLHVMLAPQLRLSLSPRCYYPLRLNPWHKG